MEYIKIKEHIPITIENAKETNSFLNNLQREYYQILSDFWTDFCEASDL